MIRRHAAKQIQIQQENEAKGRAKKTCFPPDLRINATVLYILERRRVVDQRCGQPKSLEGLGDGEIKKGHYMIIDEYTKNVLQVS